MQTVDSQLYDSAIITNYCCCCKAMSKDLRNKCSRVKKKDI